MDGRPAYNGSMFLFIGGVQPRTKVLDREPRACPACGRPALRHERTDQCLSLFFVPLFQVKKGLRVLRCESCGSIFDEAGRRWAPPGGRAGAVCRFCGRDLAEDFVCCPYCGTPRGAAPGGGPP